MTIQRLRPDALVGTPFDYATIYPFMGLNEGGNNIMAAPVGPQWPYKGVFGMGYYLYGTNLNTSFLGGWDTGSPAGSDAAKVQAKDDIQVTWANRVLPWFEASPASDNTCTNAEPSHRPELPHPAAFAIATDVWLVKIPQVTALPEMPMATDVWLVNLPQVTALPEMPMATDVWLYNLPQVTALPDMPMATYVCLYNLPQVTALPDMPMATDVCLDNLPQVTALPEMPKATNVRLDKNLSKL